MRRCSSLRTEVRRVLSPCLARPSGYAQAHSTAVSRLNEHASTRLLRTLDEAEHLLRSLEALLRVGGRLNLDSSGYRGPAQVW